MQQNKIIYTIGHSVHQAATFIEMLQSFDVKLLADIRSYPGSKRYPQYNKAPLQQALQDAGIEYIHIPALGGKRQSPQQALPNTHTPGLQGYVEHMQTDEFLSGIAQLEELASGTPLAYMCAEASWRNCHRAYVSDHLKKHGWQVIHITGTKKSELHVIRPPKGVQGRLFE